MDTKCHLLYEDILSWFWQVFTMCGGVELQNYTVQQQHRDTVLYHCCPNKLLLRNYIGHILLNIFSETYWLYCISR